MEKEKSSVKHLKVLLDNERENSKVVRRRDSEQLDVCQLRRFVLFSTNAFFADITFGIRENVEERDAATDDVGTE